MATAHKAKVVAVNAAWRAEVEEPIRTRRLTRIEYDALIERGVLDEDDPIELLEGRLCFRGEHRGSPHEAASIRARLAVDRALRPGHHVRSHFPTGRDDPSEHWPDLVALRGRYQDYLDEYPSRPVLVVEIADSTLARDRGKGARYARAGIADYWIMNLAGRTLEVYRRPVKTPARCWKYRSVRVLKPRATVSPLAAPRARLRVADLLP